MSAQGASSTAVLVCQGRATADGRYAVGRFHDPVARELLDPAERVVVDAIRAGRLPDSSAERMPYELVRWTGVSMVARTITIDDIIRGHRAAQVVILGAGLDSRAWRMPALAAATVFEVDHPASSRDKSRRLGDRAPVAGRVARVQVDLASDPLTPALEAHGFDPAAPTTWVWEGVVPYLTATAVRHTVAQVAELSATGSRFIVFYRAKSWVNLALRATMRIVFRLARQPDPMAGEPWRSSWRPMQMRQLLSDHGFATTSDDDLLTLSSGLDLPPGHTGSLRGSRIAVATRSSSSATRPGPVNPARK